MERYGTFHEEFTETSSKRLYRLEFSSTRHSSFGARQKHRQSCVCILTVYQHGKMHCQSLPLDVTDNMIYIF